MNSEQKIIQHIFSMSREILSKMVANNRITYYKRTNRHKFDFGISDIEEILEQPFIFENLRFNKDGCDINPYDILNKRDKNHVHIPGILLHLSKGETCIIHHAEKRHHKLRVICKDLTNLLMCPINCNLYLTPSNQRAFPPHTDPHDVLVLQVAGKKVWHLNREGEDQQTHIMEAGDVLYIPRHEVHYAEYAENDTAYSLHITFVIRKLYEEDILSEYALIDKNKYAKSVESLIKEPKKFTSQINRRQKNKNYKFDEERLRKAINRMEDRNINESVYSFDGSIDSVLRYGKSNKIVNKNTFLRKTNNWYRISSNQNNTIVHMKHYDLKIPFEFKYVDKLMKKNGRYQIKSIDSEENEAYLIIISELLIKRGILVICNDQSN